MRYWTAIVFLVVIVMVCQCRGKSDEKEMSQGKYQIERVRIVDGNEVSSDRIMFSNLAVIYFRS